MIISLISIVLSLLFNIEVLSNTLEFQGAKIRILNIVEYVFYELV